MQVERIENMSSTVDGCFCEEEIQAVQKKLLKYCNQARKLLSATDKPLLYFNKQFRALAQKCFDLLNQYAARIEKLPNSFATKSKSMRCYFYFGLLDIISFLEYNYNNGSDFEKQKVFLSRLYNFYCDVEKIVAR